MTSESIDTDRFPLLRPVLDLALEGLAGNAAWQTLCSDPTQAEIAHRVVTCSAYVTDCITRYPQLLQGLLSSQRLDTPLLPGQMLALISHAGGPAVSEDEFMGELRRLRHRELVRIAWRDIGGAAGLDETLADLSALADAAVNVALGFILARLEPVHGKPRHADGSAASFAVVGMGKLGGGELNFSSDIDLVFLYSGHGDSTGPRVISNEEYFRLVAQKLINLLSKKTADGFVYRVDARLRPFGDSGPLAVSLSALEDYLVQHGRDWERYAWVKARAINEWSETGYLSNSVLRPFVYRRYLDFGVFSSLREMKSMIEQEGGIEENRNNIKLGLGGIREIEFIVQSLQLVRGGTLDDLRERRLSHALQALVLHRCMTAESAQELEGAYIFLRRMENRLQEVADRQTHHLPERAIDQSRLCLAMGFSDWAALLAILDAHRSVVQAHFHDILLRGSSDKGGPSRSIGTALWQGDVDAADQTLQLEELGYADPEGATARLGGLRKSSLYQRMGRIGRERLDNLVPRVLELAGAADHPDRALEGVLRVLESIGRRSAYFALLNENPGALERLLRICGSSQRIASQIAVHPMLLDELLDQRIFTSPPSLEELQAELAARLRGVGANDIEQEFEALRNFHQAAILRVAVADLSGILPLMKVSDRLTDVAELVIQAALAIALKELTARHGSPQCRDVGEVRGAEFAVVAYGKLGGIELGYGSDLDLVFVHDSAGEDQQTDGARALDNPTFFARLTRRIIHMLTMSTSSGALYEVDTRLRPSGSSGSLVTGLAALERYQREDAWTWEHQALLRSRCVAGSPRVQQAFSDLRVRVLTEYVRRDGLRQEVREMRERMRAEISRGDAGHFDIKQDSGGVADIEFLVQYLVLQNAPGRPELLRYTDNIRQIEALVATGLLGAAEGQVMMDTYRAYRGQLHLLALADEPGLADPVKWINETASVSELWRKYML